MGEPIRVLCVFSTLDRGGAESMCMNLYRHIDRSKVQFDFVKHSHEKGMFEDEITALGGRIFEAPRYKIRNHVAYCKWWKEHLSNHPEHRIIHGHWFTISAVYFKVAHKHDCVTIGHCHSSENTQLHNFKQKVLHQIYAFYLRKVKLQSDYCFACSKDAGKWLFKSKPYTVLNNAVDSARFAFDPARRAAMREQLRIGEDEKAIFVVANLSEVKNPLGALDIYSAIRRKNPNARLFWAGEGGMRGLMEQKIAAEQIPGVTLLGTRSDVPDLLQAADVFMLCSFSEGLPVVTIEAQAAGLPCLLSEAVTRECAVTDLCTFLPIDKPELWADAAEKALTTPRRDTRPEIIRAGYDIKETSAWLTNFYLNCKG